MKKYSKRLLALFFAGCIIFSGCGESEAGSDSVQTDTVPADEQTQDNPDSAELSSAGTDNPDSAGLSAGEADNSTSAGLSAGETDNSTSAGLSAGEADNSTSESSSASVIGLADSTTGIANTLSGTQSGSPSDTTDAAALLNGEKQSVVGIITDATKYSVSIQTPTGDCYSLTIPDTGVTGNLNYIIVGQMATLTYVGALDENHAALVGISDSSLITGIYIEEYAFAIKIINAVKSMDMKELSLLTNFPVFIDTGNYKGPMNTSGEFEAIASEKIFTEALVTRMANYNLFDLQYTDAGFVMGNGTPSITFDADDEGILGIIGINSAAPPATKD